nr:hypothetical protein [Mycobacteroides salmoniphilum]
MVGAVAALHNLYRGGDGTAELIGWAGLLLLSMTALGGGVKLALWGARPVIDAGFAADKARVPESVQAVAASGVVIAGALGMWWVFRGGYSNWWQHLTGESQWTLLLGVGQMLVAVLAGAALFTGGKYLTGLAKEVLVDAGVLLERDRTSGSGAAAESVWHPGLVAALIAGGLGLVLLTAGITPRLYVWITGTDVLPAIAAITFVLLWAIGSNLGWWKGLAGLWKWATDASQKATATAGVVGVLMFSAGGLGLGWFTPATVPVARAACPPDCGGPGGSDGPPGGGQIFQPPSQGGSQMPDYQGGVNQPPMDQNGSVSIYNTQAPSVSNNGVNGSNGQQGSQQGWDQPAHGTQPPDYQNATPYTQGPGRPNPDFNPGSQGGQANPGSNAGSRGGQPNQGVQQPAQQPQQALQQQPPQQDTGQEPNQQPQQSDEQKIDDLTRQLQEKQQQSSQDRQRADDLTKQLQQNKQSQKQQQLPKFPSKDKKKDDKDEQDDRDKQSGDNDLAALLMGAASTRRRKQDEQEPQGPDTQALGQDASQAVQGLPGDVQTYVQSGQQIGQSSGQAAQGFGSAAQAGASLASSAQSGAVNPQDAITLVQGVSQGIQGTADAVNAGSQIVKTGQKEADQAAQAVGDANPQLKPQMQQLTQLNDQASQVTDLVGQGAQLTSQGAGAVNTVSSLGAGGIPDGGGTAEAMSGPASQATNAAAEAQPVELMSGPVPQDVPGDPEPAAPAVPPPPADPTINGPAGAPQLEQTRYDLVTSFPNAGPAYEYGGDPSTYPTKVGTDPTTQAITNKLPAGHRAIPTGSMTGPNGTKYEFVSTPDGTGQGVAQYVTNGSVFNVTYPSKPTKVGDLPQIFQGSGFFTTENNQTTAVVIGNTGNADTDVTRQVWTAPYDPKNPDSWINNLTSTGQSISNLPGNRESQAVPLLGGGFLFVGTSDGGISGVASGTPGGLENAGKVPLVSDSSLPTVYGPTIVSQMLSPDKTIETITMRVSAWPAVGVYQAAADAPGATPESIAAAVHAAYPDWKPSFPAEKFPYNPMTYLTTFTVQHPQP